MITIYLGDTTEYLSTLAYKQDPNARLVTEKDIDNLIDGTYYTSIGDLGNLYNLGKLLQQADKIIYAPPPNNQWTGGEPMKKWTEDYLKNFSFKCDVKNYEILVSDSSAMTRLVDQRKTEDCQIWIAGCSISHGVGVEPKNRYGIILSDLLKLPASFLTYGGSSISWAADQIMRSDIRHGDVVIWGLTSDNRIPYYTNDDIRHVNLSTYLKDREFEKILPLDELCSKNTFYRNLISVFQVSNFCQKINATLIFASLLDNDVIPHLRNFPNLIVLSNLWGREATEFFLDLGSDSTHPGPISHKFYANEIYKKYQDLLTKYSNSVKTQQ